jgi:hypothetical protein
VAGERFVLISELVRDAAVGRMVASARSVDALAMLGDQPFEPHTASSLEQGGENQIKSGRGKTFSGPDWAKTTKSISPKSLLPFVGLPDCRRSEVRAGLSRRSRIAIPRTIELKHSLPIDQVTGETKDLESKGHRS